jgi:arylsulfatase
MNRLAQEGLRFNRFHTAGICSPTRAALLTGRNPHNAGVGIVTELSNGYDGYTGVIPQTTAPVARVLRDNGYATAMFGKNHNTPTPETGPAGPFNHWPNAFGFEYFYGFNAWGTSQFQPLLYENSQPVPPRNDPDYHLTHDLADRAIKWVHNVKASDPSRPYFLYIATGATHAPHHAPRAWIDKFKGKFDTGWDAYREAAFARQKALGVIPADAKPTPRPAAVPAWDSLPEKTRRLYARQMEVFAGFAAHTDDEMGRVIDAVRSMPDGDNTLIVYVAGDNGASAEGGHEGTLSELAPANGLHAQAQVTEAQLDDLGGPKYNNNYPIGWAWAVNSPFRYYKQVVSHLGAIRNPMIMSWPARITAKGGLRTQFTNVTDVAPTLLAAAGLSAPQRVDGVVQKPMDGVSLLPVVTDAPDKVVRTRQYFEVFGNRAIYDRGWMVSARLADPWLPNRAQLDPDKVPWELYNLDHDFSQADDLAAKNPERLKRLQALWWSEAKRNNVLPLDWRAGERMASRARIDPRSKFVFYPGTSAIPEALAPIIRNRSWTLTARGVFGPDDKGVLITQGGFTGGWSFYLKDGRPTFDYNLSIPGIYHIVADSQVPPGTRTITAKFEYDQGSPPNRGRGGTLTLYADERQVASGRLERTLPSVFSLNEGLDVGADFGSPAGDYPLPYAFSGAMKEVQVDLR